MPAFTSRLSFVRISAIGMLGAAGCVGLKAKSKKETQRSLLESTMPPLKFCSRTYSNLAAKKIK
nr:MAG TPA: hypothetical protein [Caudoviricetes sp.]